MQDGSGTNRRGPRIAIGSRCEQRPGSGKRQPETAGNNAGGFQRVAALQTNQSVSREPDWARESVAVGLILDCPLRKYTGPAHVDGVGNRQGLGTRKDQAGTTGNRDQSRAQGRVGRHHHRGVAGNRGPQIPGVVVGHRENGATLELDSASHTGAGDLLTDCQIRGTVEDQHAVIDDVASQAAGGTAIAHLHGGTCLNGRKTRVRIVRYQRVGTRFPEGHISDA